MADASHQSYGRTDLHDARPEISVSLDLKTPDTAFQMERFGFSKVRYVKYFAFAGIVSWTFIIWNVLSPGVFAHDSMVSLHEGQSGVFTSNQPPLLGYLWNLLDAIGNGASLLILISVAGLTFGSYLIYRRAFSALLSLVLMGLTTLYPPIFVQIGTINKESISCNLILLAFAMLCYSDDSAWQTIILTFSALLTAIAVMTRYQYILVAFPALCALLTYFLLLGKRIKKVYYARQFFIGSILFLAFMVGIIVTINFTADVSWNAPFTSNWRLQVEYDLASLIANSPYSIVKKAGPILQVNPEFLASTAKLEYTPSTNITLRKFIGILTKVPTSAISNAVSSLEARNNWELLYHHAYAYADLLGLGKVCWPLQKEIPHPLSGSHDANLAREIHLNRFSQSIASRFIFDSRWLPANTFLFRPIFYIGLYLVASFWAFRYRRRRARFLWLSGLPTSAFVYMLSFAPITPSCDFRYSYWLVVGSVIFTILVSIFGTTLLFGESGVGNWLKRHVRS